MICCVYLHDIFNLYNNSLGLSPFYKFKKKMEAEKNLVIYPKVIIKVVNLKVKLCDSRTYGTLHQGCH